MKKLFILLLGFMVYTPANSQIIKEIDQVSSFNEELAAIKKGDQWAFMDTEGKIVIDFRDDLVPVKNTTSEDKSPMFNNGRAMIRLTEDKVTYYGYIDKTGKDVILAEYVNATPFKDGFALVMQYSKEVVGQNKLLGKDVVSYQIEEFVINPQGKAMTPMLNTRNYVPDKMKSGKVPAFTTVFLGNRMVGAQNADGQWEIYKF